MSEDEVELPGIKAAGEDSVAGRRLHEMRDFYAFFEREMATLMDRWREQYDGQS